MKQNKESGAIKKTIDELCTPNGITIGNSKTKTTPNPDYVPESPEPLNDNQEGFTGGEWKLYEMGEGNYRIKSGGQYIASVNSAPGWVKEAEVNAALIAESKNMYEALKDMVEEKEQEGRAYKQLSGEYLPLDPKIKEAKAILNRINSK